MKKNKLYTANKWNQPAFMVDRESHNIFDGTTFGQSSLMSNNSSLLSGNNKNPFGLKPLTAPSITPRTDWSNPAQAAMALGKTKAMVDNFSFNTKQMVDSFGTGKTPLTVGLAPGIGGAVSGGSSGGNFLGNLTSKMGGVDGIMGAVGGISTQVSDMLSGGHSSGVGTGLKTIGGLVKNIPVIGKFGVAAELVGGAFDGLFGGPKVDEGKARANAEGTAAYNNYHAEHSLDAEGPVAQANVQDAWTNSLFGGGASAKNEEVRQARIEAKQKAYRDYANMIHDVTSDQLNDALADYSAFGGPIETKDDENTYDMGGVLEYGMALDNLNLYRQAIQNKNKMTGMMQMPAFMPQNGFAFGGDAQIHGADFPTGLMHIDAGGSHESNPYDGVQLGTDRQGIPNLVEEGETVFDDYVFSRRIFADGGTLQKFHLPKKSKLTFAEVSKKLEKQIKERENDPIAQAGFKANMETLREEQERQKQEMDAQRAKEAFEAMTPEEQTALMQQVAEQEQAQQQMAMQQEAMAQQGVSPEEMAMAQQQQMMQDGSEANLGQEPQMAAMGGCIHKFPDGGKLYEKIFNLLDKHTMPDFVKWAKDNGFTWAEGSEPEAVEDLDWEELLQNNKFREAISKNNPALADALKNGYDFGQYQAPATGGKTYAWDKFWEPTNEYSKQAGNADNKYRIDSSYKGKVKDLEASEDYQNFTNYILNNASDEERMNYFKWIDDNTGRKNKYIKDGRLVDNWKDMYQSARTDGLYGIQHYTPTMTEATRGAQAGNFVVNDDGSVEQWYGDVPADFTSAGNYAWQGKDSDFARNYYRRPVAAAETEAAKTPEEKVEEFKKNVKPKYQKGLFGIEDAGPLVALGMQALGVGRPDTSGLEAAASAAGNYTTASWMPRGDFMKLKLTDPWRYTMPILASSRATDRAILNSGANQGSKMAGLLANGYNTTISLGDAALKGDDVNWQRYVTQKTHDADVWKSNQGEYGQTSRFNASAYNDAARANAQLKFNAAREKMAADNDWYGSMYANVNNLFKGMGARRKENRSHNMIADMAANGLFGVITPDSPMGQRYLQWANSSAEGGKIKKKKRKGLTF